MATTIGRSRFGVDERTSIELAAGGSIAEALISGGAVLLAILGLAGVYPLYAASLASLAIGAALLFEGGALGARFARTLKQKEGDSLTTGDVAGGVTAELFAGVLGLALASLALVGFAPLALLPTAALVYSVGLLTGCAALSHVSTSVHEGDVDPVAGAKRDAVLIAAGVQLVASLVGAVLGIAALLGTATLALSLLAFMVLGASEILSGVAFGARMMEVRRRMA